MNRNWPIALRTGLLAASSLALLAVAGCDQPGSAESAGRKIDQSMEKMSQKMGQKVDQVAESARQGTVLASQALDDTAITARVKARFLAEPGLQVLMIDVDTRDGQVTLTGSADSLLNVQRAAQVASAVEGVKSVDNRLAVSTKS